MEGANGLGPLLETLTNEPSLLPEAAGELSRFSLIRWSAHRATYSVHRLVQAVFRATMSQDEQRQWVERTIQAPSQRFETLWDYTTQQ